MMTWQAITWKKRCYYGKGSLEPGDIARGLSGHSPHILRLPAARMWLDYDKEADVLYISFNRPQRATESEMLGNGILLRHRGDELVGLTVLDASKR
ncbi:DUF2283 domain-containing protein [Dehalococcoidia bacterium]|nr:DUF2283 domain-containing protein [Dehalococcoidia bacterium]